MYLLKDSEGNITYLLSSKVTKVGRKYGDILLSKDTSVSKEHATLTVQLNKNSKDAEKYSLIVKDSNSKYGSTIVSNANGKTTKVTQEGNCLEHMDKVTFGLQNKTFTVFFIPLITAMSKLKKQDSSKLAEIMKKVDGVVCLNWSDECTHVTTIEATLTKKVVFALASCIPVVGVNYWEAVLKAVETNQHLPDGANYSLMINESHIVHSLSPNPRRKTLFSGLTFVHFCKDQQLALLPMIECAGGKSVMSSDINLDNANKKNLLFVQLTTEESQYQTQVVSAYRSMTNLLKRNNKRVIGKTEIPLAILYCSTEKQCNPEYNFSNLIKVKIENTDVINSAILREDTQDVQPPKNDIPVAHRIIPETCESISDSGAFLSENELKNFTEVRSQENGKNLPNKVKPSNVENAMERVTRIVPETIESTRTSQESETSTQETSFMFSERFENPTKASTSQVDSRKRKNENVGSQNKRPAAFSFVDDDMEEIAPPPKKQKEQEKSKDDWGFTRNNCKYDGFEDLDSGKDECTKKEEKALVVEKFKLKKNEKAEESDLEILHIAGTNEEKIVKKRKRSDDIGENVVAEKKGNGRENVDYPIARASTPEEPLKKKPRERNLEVDMNLSFLRKVTDLEAYGKTFKKVYKNIPKERIQFCSRNESVRDWTD